MGTSAKVLADSIAPCGKRLTTFECVFHRYILAEVNTHRMFSRGSASSRAIPVAKRIQSVLDDPAMPLAFGKNQKGMQSTENLEEREAAEARHLWLLARDYAVTYAKFLSDLGVHKQFANRIIEPYCWHTAVISFTEDEHFWSQRRHKDAAPEFQALAEAMWAAREASTPVRLDAGQWHLPYVDVEHGEHRDILDWWEKIEKRTPFPWAAISAARCARVSYLTQDGRKSFDDDYALYLRLVGGDPKHSSPLEHPAQAEDTLRRSGNFIGWRQLRESVDPLFIKQ
jgi:hypothetical protein